MNNTDSRYDFPLIMSKNNNVNKKYSFKIEKIRLYKLQSKTSCTVCNSIFQNSYEFSTKWH